MYSHFQQHDFWLLIPSLVSVTLSVAFFLLEKPRLALFFLTLGGLGLRFFMAQLDPFLNNWDEKYHALVAENLSHHLLKPTLIDSPVIPYDYKQWVENHIWLHKPPMALWQMAISILIFGVSEIAIRIPMVLMSTILIPVIYRIGSIVINKNVGFYAAFLWTLNWYSLNFVAGKELTEHIDVTFVFYIPLSIWAWLEYTLKPGLKYLFLIGFFAGLAVLTKWLTGLLVYACWFIAIVSSKEERKEISSYLNLLKALLISIIVFLPWQIYIFSLFPNEAHFEMEFSRRHFTEVIEGHSGNALFYIDYFSRSYGKLAIYLILPALFIFWFKAKQMKMKVFILSAIFITYIFFTIAATKMPAFVFIVGPLIFLAFGSLMDFLISYLGKLKIPYSKLIPLVPILAIGFFTLKLKNIELEHTDAWNNTYYLEKVRLTKLYKKIARQVPPGAIIFGNKMQNCTCGCEVDLMFYTQSTAYGCYPDSALYTRLKKENYKLAAFKSNEMPGYMSSDKELLKLDYVLNYKEQINGN